MSNVLACIKSFVGTYSLLKQFFYFLFYRVLFICAKLGDLNKGKPLLWNKTRFTQETYPTNSLIRKTTLTKLLD